MKVPYIPLILSLGLVLTAKDKPKVTIKVVDSQASERAYTQYIPGTPGNSTTGCNSNATVYGSGGTATANGTTNCTTTTNPGSSARTVQRAIQQEHVRAIMPDGKHITLWCQAGFRRCSALSPGSYLAELSGNTVWIEGVDLDGVTKHKVKYRFVGGW